VLRGTIGVFESEKRALAIDAEKAEKEKQIKAKMVQDLEIEKNELHKKVDSLETVQKQQAVKIAALESESQKVAEQDNPWDSSNDIETYGADYVRDVGQFALTRQYGPEGLDVEEATI